MWPLSMLWPLAMKPYTQNKHDVSLHTYPKIVKFSETQSSYCQKAFSGQRNLLHMEM